MKSYAAARSLFSFLEVISWIVIISGVILMLLGFGGTGDRSVPGIFAFVPGVIIAFCGFIGLVQVQVARASVDSAEYGQQSLKVARDQLEISRQMMTMAQSKTTSYAAAATNKPQERHGGTTAEAAPNYKARPSSSKPAPERAIGKAGAGVDERPKVDTPKAAPALPEPATLPRPPKEIHFADGAWRYGTMTFKSEDAAKAYVAQFGVNPNATVNKA